MYCPICSEKMVGMFNTPELSVLKCKNCSFLGLDLESWQYPYSDKDYYCDINEADINPERPFVLRRVDFVKKYTEGGKGKRLAELGCGLGETAVALSRAGFDVYGIEESRNATEFLKERFSNVKWINENINTFLTDNKGFDVITLFHVFEHILQPRRFADLCRSALNSASTLIVEVPDVHGGLAKLRGRKWEHWLPHHVNYFGKKSLCHLFESVGMRLIKAERLYHFGWPQGVLWKDIIHETLAFNGLNSIIRTCFRLNSTN